ncbi:MAG: prepilin-type N-terminal cleavage/methylation domain-containing protein [Polyangiales bacterium]
MRRSRADFGFSLLELMVVVTIIAVLSALVLPSMSQAMRERHAQEAAIDVTDMLREVRGRAMYRGRAQTVVIRQVGTAVRLEAYEGTESSCRLSRFRLTAGTGFVEAEQIAVLDLGAAQYARDSLASTIAIPTGTTFLQLCHTPMGNTFFSTTEISIPARSGATTTARWGRAARFRSTCSSRAAASRRVSAAGC